jgi:hypothetical protein
MALKYFSPEAKAERKRRNAIKALSPLTEEKSSKFWLISGVAAVAVIAGFTVAAKRGNAAREASLDDFCSKNGGLELVGKEGSKVVFTSTRIQETPDHVKAELKFGGPIGYISPLIPNDPYRPATITFTKTEAGLMPDSYKISTAGFELSNAVSMRNIWQDRECLENLNSKLKTAAEVAALRASYSLRHQSR